VTPPDAAPHAGAGFRAFAQGLGGFTAKTVALCVALVAAYALVPLEGDWGWAGLVAGGGAALAIVVVVVRRVRRVLHAERPVPEAIAAIVVTATLTIFTSSATYFAMSQSTEGSFRGLETKVDATYFAVTIMTTVGFGDIVPVSQAARLVTTLHMIFTVALVGAALRLITLAARHNLSRRGGAAGPSEASGPPLP
jgi:hypothetical protein